MPAETRNPGKGRSFFDKSDAGRMGALLSTPDLCFERQRSSFFLSFSQRDAEPDTTSYFYYDNEFKHTKAFRTTAHDL